VAPWQTGPISASATVGTMCLEAYSNSPTYAPCPAGPRDSMVVTSCGMKTSAAMVRTNSGRVSATSAVGAISVRSVVSGLNEYVTGAEGMETA
jgi:hypothetical protein